MTLHQPRTDARLEYRPGPGGLIARWRAELAGTGSRVALADGADPRVVHAAAELAAAGLTPCIIDRPDRVRAVARESGTRLPDSVEILDPRALAQGPAGAAVAEAFGRRTPEEVAGFVADPLHLAVASVAADITDACIAGATRTTKDVLRASLRLVGTAEWASSVSSCFIMELADGRPLAFADCAVLPEPDADQLSEIALASTETLSFLTGIVPKVAMLSFSTLGSADHPSVDVVRRATEGVRRARPDLAVDGELQLDAAVVESVARRKAPNSIVGGAANVLIFPNLAAGNIAYKITERLAGATGHGPILQGLARPIHDLSRGCSASDIVGMALIAGLQSITTPRSAHPAALR